MIQRVSSASVEVKGERLGQIEKGLVVLLGIASEDDPGNAEKLAERMLNYRVFSDDSGRMNLSLKDSDGQLLIISQFTLCANTSKGLRPSFSTAATPEVAERLYDEFVSYCSNQIATVETGKFGADMQVSLINDGPVTFLLESQ